MRHQAGRSSPTEISRDRTSSSSPGASGSMWRRMRSRSPLPQSRSPPSKLTFAGNGCGMLVADAGGAADEPLDELGAAHDLRAVDEAALVETALLEARRAHIDDASRL